MKASDILITEPSADYELLDSGEGEKLERFGKVLLSRPDPQALWSKKSPVAEWKKADGSFTRDESKGGWSIKPNTPASWPITLGGLKFAIKPTPFKHVGIFPEQVGNWQWLAEQVKNDIEVLNLFGYTGGATLACAQAGAKVVHIDGSKSAIAWARENAELSGLAGKPVRWILEDARAFVAREIKRERKYDGIIMDPPSFGHGPDNEVWKIEENLLGLIQDCFKILKDKPLFFLINGYAAGYSALAYENVLISLKEKYGGEIEMGELAIRESSSSRSEASKRGLDESKPRLDQRLLPCGIYARWSSR